MKNNKLIAEFMDLRSTGLSIYKPSEYKYHTSWDWLMPVVQKIGNEYLNTPFDETYSKLTEGYENIWTLEDTYDAVVEFIKDQNNKDSYNYYTDSNVINGLKECIYFINEVTPKDEQGKYHKELLNSLKDAIKQLKPIIKY